ncbi:MAG TPA: DNA repair protein RecN [Acidimicrobiia bacterium]|nr:DNA repair protein RecN [Acidimicrobiia bacterium]
MLTELHVADLGIVADLKLVLGPGLTAITGETGAGKTLLVEALELLVGGRADTTLIRDGASEAHVEGRFLDPISDEEAVLARILPLEGRSRAYVDGRLATVAELAEVGTRFVDLHGQHAHQSLLAPAVQRGALDHFAGPAAADPLAEYRAARAEQRRIDADLAALGGDERSRAREIDLLRFQIDEIEAAGLDDESEDVALEAEEALLADAIAHREALAAAYGAVESSALDAVGAAATALSGRSPFAQLGERLRATQAELAELARELRVARDSIEDDPDRLETIRARRRLLRELTRKYGETLADVRAYGIETTRRLAELEGYETRAAELEAESRAARERAASAASSLSQARLAAAVGLADAITPHLQELAMPSANFEVVVEAAEPTDDGADRVTFLLSANPGEPSRPLARVASGGELSRAMLAARVVLSEAPPTLVFDEIDAGIGGEAGAAVGRLLADLAGRHQVLVVTHLAQVAAFADAQIVVEKREQGKRTVASAQGVAGEERIRELSRMLAGVGESAHARSHAAELLDAAETFKQAKARGPA